MILIEKRCDLFSIENCYYAHCISRDFALGAGIAVEFKKRYDMKNKLEKMFPYGTETDCVVIDNVFNLITKEKYWHKPTYQSLRSSLEIMCEIATIKNIKKIAMPRIGCGLDRLNWKKVKTIIEKVFMGTEIEIVVCYL